MCELAAEDLLEPVEGVRIRLVRAQRRGAVLEEEVGAPSPIFRCRSVVHVAHLYRRHAAHRRSLSGGLSRKESAGSWGNLSIPPADPSLCVFTSGRSSASAPEVLRPSVQSSRPAH